MYSPHLAVVGAVSYQGPGLKPRKLLILHTAKSAKSAQIAQVRYTAGTRPVVSPPVRFYFQSQNHRYPNFGRCMHTHQAPGVPFVQSSKPACDQSESYANFSPHRTRPAVNPA